MTTATPRKVGERVRVDHPKYPGVWTITKTGPVNAVLEPENGGRNLRAPYSLLTDPDAVTVTQVPIITIFDVGELVRIPEGKFAGLYVVIRDTGADKVNVAKIGGDGGRYVRALRRNLTKVDPSEVLK